MGKKAKPKKITGTPEVVKFKQTRAFLLLKELVNMSETLPVIDPNIDPHPLDRSDCTKVARFLNMVGLLAEHLGIQSKKEYRFNFHHKYLAPTPQFFPFGFDVHVVREAQLIREKPTIMYNGQHYSVPEELRADASDFLQAANNFMNRIPSITSPRLDDDFADTPDGVNGLKKFKNDLKDDIQIFDTVWLTFEQKYLKVKLDILNRVFEPIEKLVTLELLLTQAEERLDIETKQQLESDFVLAVQNFTQVMFPDLVDVFPEDVIPLAEACIFYESRCTEEWLHLAKHLLKDYMELRKYIAQIPQGRISPNLRENEQLMMLLRTFFASVITAKEALESVSKLPKLIHAKTSDWMTKRLLDPDLEYIQKMSSAGKA